MSASLYFYYSSMNAGKSSHLLQAAFNYRQGGATVQLLSPSIDDRSAVGKISSRVGLEADSEVFNRETDLSNILDDKCNCVLIDEAQFMTKEQVDTVAFFVDIYNIPVLCYGLKVDFTGNLFEGSSRLLCQADNICEIKSICSEQNCFSKATHVLRLDANGKAVKSGEQVIIGDSQYRSVCRKHFYSNFMG